jgi:hypothetical protein
MQFACDNIVSSSEFVSIALRPRSDSTFHPKSGTPTNRSTEILGFRTSIGRSFCACGCSRGAGVDFALCVSLLRME